MWAAVLVSDQGLGKDARHGNLVAATSNQLASASHTFAVARNLLATAARFRRHGDQICRRGGNSAAVASNVTAAARLRPPWRRFFATTLPMG